MPNAVKFEYEGHHFEGTALVEFPHKEAAQMFKEHTGNSLDVDGVSLNLRYKKLPGEVRLDLNLEERIEDDALTLDILPALPPPPPPRPVAVEVKTSEQGTGGTGLRGVLEKQVKEHGQSRQSIWKGAQSATDEILSAPAFSAKQTSEVRKVPSPQQEPAQAFHLEPDEAGDDEKDTWSWWKGHWWDWDSQEKRYIEVEQRDKADSDMELDFASEVGG
eukprot:symbB.v1.2.029209.t1/scaffold3171.1/size96351/9